MRKIPKKRYKKRLRLGPEIMQECVLERLRGRSAREISALTGANASVIAAWVKRVGKALAKEHGLPYPPEKMHGSMHSGPAASGLPPSEAILALVAERAQARGDEAPPTAEQLPLSMTTADVAETVLDRQNLRNTAHKAEVRIEGLRRMLMGKESTVDIAGEMGVPYQSLYTWYKKYGPALAAKLGLPYRQLRQHRVPGARDDDALAFDMTAADMAQAQSKTSLSRPSPSNPQPNGRPPRYADYGPETTDDAETARLKARIAFLETSLRQALRERNAFEVILELEQAKPKAQNPPGDF